MNHEKCQLAKAEINYLGYIVGSGNKKVDPLKLEIVHKFVMPRNKKQIRSFLGFVTFYRMFIPNFSELTSPLTSLLKKDKTDLCEITEVEIEAYERLKKYCILQLF